VKLEDLYGQKIGAKGESVCRLTLATVLLFAAGCPWSMDNAYDPLRCGANCALGEICYNGKCLICLPGHLGDRTCATEGFDSGTLKCTSEGSLDTSQCKKGCGNSVVDGTEECDGTALGGLTCETLSYEGGTLTCQSDCKLDTSMCSKQVFVDVSAGTFVMGSPVGEPCREATETEHSVKLSLSFSMMRNEVTADQFKNMMGYAPAEQTSCSSFKCPVHALSWSEAVAYCNKLSAAEDNVASCYDCKGEGADVTCTEAPAYSGADAYDCPGYRLPTEAEWEYAYRAGTSTSLHYGAIIDCDTKDATVDAIGWFRDNSGESTHPVGEKWANDWGLFDMAGNVSEWCHDWTEDDLGSQAVTDPWGVASGTTRAIRGGSAFDIAGHLRAAYRAKGAPTTKPKGTGFRCVRSVLTCGDAAIQEGEACDGTLLNNKTCKDLGFYAGALGCTAKCVFDTSKCVHDEISVSGGTFTMGSPESENCRQTTETEHQVTLTHDFEMMRTEATQKSYIALLGYNGSGSPACGEDCAADYITWHRAAAYCNALSILSGLEQCYACTGADWYEKCATVGKYEKNAIYDCTGYRLPTEAEWEYAYRAGTTTALYNGDLAVCTSIDTNASAIGWYYDNSSAEDQRVAMKAPNAWGLYDMAGNVWEWCHDYYEVDLGASPKTDPVGTDIDGRRVMRGGSYYVYAEEMRAAFRRGHDPTSTYYVGGVRCVRSK
jgi:formylglycine-generating enzyme required for sulfatase activity